ncbi:hypothetical protein [Carboxylicivirga caseinilyticus]|uniref:hypothetical protein n=1 Tax=Carboxylicivirga caseinilyticus TaxID=3417572 RepID=UPI003D33EB6A|nr:hypothetical protein [Marinilabiliaceae bacterium A049]
MTKILFLLSVLFISTSLLAQSEFTKGFYINKEGNADSCYIQVEQWRDIPAFFLIKTHLDSMPEKVYSNQIDELVIGESYKFKSEKVEVDNKYLSGNQIRRIKNDSLFLRVVVEGEASLFMAGVDDNVTFWYSFNHGDLKLLKYRKYISSNGKEMEDYSFKSQIQADFKCEAIGLSDIIKLKYDQKALTNFFISYNDNCSEEQQQKYFSNTAKQAKRVTLSPKIGLSRFSMVRPAGELSSPKIWLQVKHDITLYF